MHPFQRFLQNLIAQRGWSEPQSMGSQFDWQFTHEDGRTRRYNEDLQDAYYRLMGDEDFPDAEIVAWTTAAKSIFPNTSGLELEIDETGDVIEYTSEPGAWVEVTGRIWVPFKNAVDASKHETSNASE